MDTFDSFKKKYVSAWADSMAPFLLVMEGDLDKENKTMTMTGQGRSPAGIVKYKATTKMTDADSMEFNLFAPGEGGKEAVMLTIVYKRKK